jgi:hypothetical protein
MLDTGSVHNAFHDEVSVNESTPAEVSAQRTLFYGLCQGVRLRRTFAKIDSSGNRKQRSGHFGSSSFQVALDCNNHYEWRGEFDETNPEKLAKIRILDGVRCSWQGLRSPSFAMFPVW